MANKGHSSGGTEKLKINAEEMVIHQQMVAHCLSKGYGFIPGTPPKYSMNAIADFMGMSLSTLQKLGKEDRPESHSAGEYFDYIEFAVTWRTDSGKTKKIKR